MVKKFVLGLIVLISLGLVSCGGESSPAISADARLQLANAYYTNGLYQAAVDEYLDYTAKYKLDETRQANTYFTVANIYFERLNDYEKALEYYFKIKYLYPASSLQGEVAKRIVSCLERLEKSADAARILEKEAALDQSQVHEHRPGAVLAELGSRKITQGDLDFEISKMPVYLQEDFQDVQKKKELLQQFVLRELLYDSAKRQQLDQDKEIIEGTFRAKKALMAEKLLQKELQGQVKIEPDDVELYYLAHKDKYVEKDDKGNVKRQLSLQEAEQQVARDLNMERQQQAYQKLVDRLMKAENVKLYEDRIR